MPEVFSALGLPAVGVPVMIEGGDDRDFSFLGGVRGVVLRLVFSCQVSGSKSAKGQNHHKSLAHFCLFVLLVSCVSRQARGIL